MGIATVLFSDFRGLQCFVQLSRVVDDGAFSVCLVWMTNRPEVTNAVYELHRVEVGRRGLQLKASVNGMRLDHAIRNCEVV